jgi:hypothetical protein
MADALCALPVAAGEAPIEPVVEIFRWNDTIEWDSIYQREPEYRPSRQRPLVYHLFGHMSAPDSLVLSEDDYFQYLMAIDKPNQLPNALIGPLSQYALLIVGFRSDDWDFRVLLRSLFKSAGRAKKATERSVAVQFVPEEGMLQPERARVYMQKYFQDVAIETFWGGAADFVSELAKQRDQ